MNTCDPIEHTIEYVDALFGPGMGERHVRFLESITNPALRDLIHRFHAIEADTRFITVEENYLLAVCVLCSLGKLATAAMFAKLLRQLGTPSERILEAVGRVAMWAGGLPAVEASFAIQKALSEFDRDPAHALAVWFPEVEKP
jgi:hypothetical protein